MSRRAPWPSRQMSWPSRPAAPRPPPKGPGPAWGWVRFPPNPEDFGPKTPAAGPAAAPPPLDGPFEALVEAPRRGPPQQLTSQADVRAPPLRVVHRTPDEV